MHGDARRRVRRLTRIKGTGVRAGVHVAMHGLSDRSDWTPHRFEHAASDGCIVCIIPSKLSNTYTPSTPESPVRLDSSSSSSRSVPCSSRTFSIAAMIASSICSLSVGARSQRPPQVACAPSCSSASRCRLRARYEAHSSSAFCDRAAPGRSSCASRPRRRALARFCFEALLDDFFCRRGCCCWLRAALIIVLLLRIDFQSVFALPSALGLASALGLVGGASAFFFVASHPQTARPPFILNASSPSSSSASHPQTK